MGDARRVAASLAVIVALGCAPATRAPAAPAGAPALVGGLTALPGRQSGGGNLLANPGFEDGEGRTAPAWKLTPADPWSLDSGARSGRHSLKLAGAEGASIVPSAEQAVTLEPGFYTIEGWAKAEALGTAPRTGARLCLDGRPRLNWWMCTDLVRGTSDWTLLRQASIPVRQPGPYRVTVGAYGRPGGSVRFDDVALTRLTPPLLDVYLLYPNFRGMLFADRPQTVRVSLRATSAAEARAEGARIRLSLVEPKDGREVRHRDYPASTTATVGELDASGLPEGAFLLRAELVAAGGVRYRYPDYRIVKLPAAARRGLTVWYDEHNVTYLDGKPAFVIGLYDTTGYSESRQSYAQARDGWGVDRIAQAPVNMLINYWLGAAPVPALTAYMDELASRGIHYLQTVNFYHPAHPQYRTLPYPTAREGEDALNRWVGRTLSAHRGLAGFYTADERTAEMIPTVFAQHAALAQAAPGTVTYAVLGDGWQDQAPLWRDAVDVMGLDPYPLTRHRDNDLAMVGEWTRLGREAVMASRPVWMVLQYFQLTAAGGWPSYEQLRAMSWMAIVEGARGLFYWSFGTRGLTWVKDLKLREQRWDDLVRVTREIKALEPVLLAPDAAVASAESSGGAVRALGKQLGDGRRYLFAYNTRKTPTTVVWTLAASATGTVDLATGQPGPAPEGTRLAVSFAPFEVKRYQLR